MIPRLACLAGFLFVPAAAIAAPVYDDPAARVRVAPGVTGLTASAVHADSSLARRAEGWVRDLTSGWAPNLGQVADIDGNPVEGVLYSMRTEGSQLHVTRRGLSAFFVARPERGRQAPGEDEKQRKEESDFKERRRRWAAFEIELVGATIRPEKALAGSRIESLGEQHFYAPHCPEGVIGIPSHERVTFRDVYPGIDWVLIAGRDGAMHQDFVVHPGADPGRIRLRYHGAKDLRLDAARRTLHLRTALGDVSEGPLLCTQGAQEVPAKLSLRGDLLTVRIPKWDRSAPLTIDPPLLWSTLYGGESYDGPKSIYCDNLNGDVYVVGYSASTSLPCTTAAAPLAYFDGTSQAAPDAFIWKFSQQGVRQWATYYAGNGQDYATDCVVDRLGNLYVVGHTSSTNFPVKFLSGAYWQPINRGAIDAFILRFDAQGVRQWATYYGGDANDFCGAVAADSTDQVYMAGYGGSTNLITVDPGGGAYYQPALNGGSDAFILKFNTLCALVWGTYHGGDDGEAALGIAANATSVCVVGQTFSTVFPTVDPPGNGDYFDGTANGAQDAFISRFTLGGVPTWSTFYGGSNFDELWEPAFTPAGDLYISGLSNSADFPVFNPNPIATPNQPAYFQAANAGQFDLVMLRFATNDARTWATYFGGSSSEDLGRAGRSLVIDSLGRAHLTGVSASNDFPLANPAGGAYYRDSTSGSDVIYARFATTDSLEWGTFFGGGGSSFGTAVAIGIDGCLFGTGEFQSSGFNTPPVNPPGAGAWFRTTPSGDDDGFVTKFCRKPHACCIELNCEAVTSAAECAALSGTAFYPNQTCAQTSCSILCTVCGRKFSDLDRNGVQNGGEPGLPGWTIELRNGANAVVATAVTDANGDYCFDDIPCGPYTVTESVQNGWVQIAPPGAGHSLSLPIASTTNGVNFGNYSCPTTSPCSPMPIGLAAWWPFDDGPGASQAMDVTHASTGRNGALLAGGAASGAGSLCLSGPDASAKVLYSSQRGLDFGAGSFGIAAWIHPEAGSANGRVVVEKRGLGGGGGFAGWSLYLDGLHCMLSIETGSAPQIVAGPMLPAGAWSHVAVSVDRATGHGNWYMNGAPLSSADFTPIAGSVDNAADLTIGQTDPSLGLGGPGLMGCLAQLALFDTPISPDVAAKAFGPGSPGIGVPLPWCPFYALIPATRTICPAQNSVQICFTIGNNTAAPATYSWSLAGLPAGPGCTQAGPTQFSPSSGTVTVPAGGLSGSICVTVARSNAFTAQGATACFALNLVNHATGACRTYPSKLQVDNSCWCGTANPTAIAPVPAGGRIIGFTIKHPCDPIAWMPFRVVPRDPETGVLDSSLVSLGGALPGAPFHGMMSAGPGNDALIDVFVRFPSGFDAAAQRELVLEADTDGDGVFETLAGTFIAPEDEQTTTGVPAAPGRQASGLRARPVPFVATTTLEFTLGEDGPVSLEIYDFAGRLVRSLARSWLSAGPRRLAWDGRDDAGRRVAPGVYFARLRTADGTKDARVVKVQ